MSPTAIVIGAGVAGLATATLLAREGYQVTIIERLDSVGGRAGDLRVDSAPGFRWDTGPSWYLMPEAFEHFFELCGTTAEQELDLVRLDPGYRIFPQGREVVDVPTGIEPVADLFESFEPGAGQRLRDYLRQAEDSYDIAVERFLYTTFSEPTALLHRDIRQRAGQLARLLTTSLDSWVSRQFSHPVLRQILSYPAVFLSSRPTKTPALYHLMSHTDLVQGVAYPRGGFHAVIAAVHRLATQHGVRVECNTEVTAITYRDSVATGVQVRDADGTVRTLASDIVVSAGDLHHTETQLLPEHLRSYSHSYFARRDPGIGTVLVMLGVQGRLPQLRHHNLFFSEDWTPDFDAVFSGPHPSRPLGSSQSIYVSMPSATDETVAPPDHENLFILVPVPAEHTLGHGSAYHSQPSAAVEAIADAAVSQIASWAEIPDLAERIVVRRTLGPADFSERYCAWRGGAIGPAHTLRQSAFLRGKNTSSTLSGLYYAGATTVPGVGVPMCLISAENVIKRLRGDRSPGPLHPEAP